MPFFHAPKSVKFGCKFAKKLHIYISDLITLNMPLNFHIYSTFKKHMDPFLFGLFCSIIGIGTSWLLFSKTFPDSIGIIAVFFTSFALFPFWDKLLSSRAVFVGMEENVRQNKEISLTELRPVNPMQKFNPLNSLRTHKNTFAAYIFSFLGIFIVFAMLQLILPADLAESMFLQQTSIFGVSASAVPFGETIGQAASILMNNFFVLIICFLISLLYRSGIFIVAWNASVWGVIFGMVVRQSAACLNQNSWILFIVVVLIMLPHMVGEAFAYLAASVSGGLTFKAVWNKISSKESGELIVDALVILVLAFIVLAAAALVEIYFATPTIQSVLGNCL